MPGMERGTLSRDELLSVKALVAYQAHNQKAAEETVAAVVGARFNVEDMAVLARKDYEAVIRFLVDLRLSDVTN
jgi:hypothetical protein